MNLQLLVIAGPDEGRTFLIAQDRVLTIGRGDEADVQLNDPEVSREHCRLRALGEQAVVTDHQSRGGTFVNGQRISERRLQVGDEMQIGTTRLRIQAEVKRDADTITNMTAPPQVAAPTAPSPATASPFAPAAGPPVILNVESAPQPAELVKEQIADVREQRDTRQEYRKYYREDRSSNQVGVVGLAMSAATLVLAVSSLLFYEQLPMYRGLVGCFGFPLTIAALVCSIIGCARRDRRQTTSVIGLVIGLLLLLFVLPALMMKWS